MLAKFTLVVAIIIFLFLPIPVWMGTLQIIIVMALSYIFGTIFSAIAGKGYGHCNSSKY